MGRGKLPSPALSRFLLRPRALDRRPEAVPVAAACIASLLVVFVGDAVTPIQIVVSALGLIPLLAAMWLLSGRLALLVGAVAVGQLVATGALGALSLVTVASEVVAYLLLALVCRLYAQSIANLLQNAPRPSPRNPSSPSLLSAPLTVTGRRESSNGIESLTRRERQVAGLAAQGYTAREIGNRLHIGRRTVETHLVNIYDKLGVRSKRELMRTASGLAVEPPGDAEGHPAPVRSWHA